MNLLCRWASFCLALAASCLLSSAINQQIQLNLNLKRSINLTLMMMIGARATNDCCPSVDAYSGIMFIIELNIVHCDEDQQMNRIGHLLIT